MLLKVKPPFNIPTVPHLINSVFLLSSPPLGVSTPIPALGLEALEPLSESIGEVLPADCTGRKVRPEIIAMLRICHCVAEKIPLLGLNTALRCIGESIDLGSEGLSAERAECAPGVKFTAGPVHVAGADVPASEDLVGAVCVGPLGQQAARRTGELAMADVGLVLEGVVLRDNLVGAEVCGLEVAPLGAVLPSPAYRTGIREALVQVAGTSNILLTRAFSLEVAVDERSERLPCCPAVNDGLGAL